MTWYLQGSKGSGENWSLGVGGGGHLEYPARTGMYGVDLGSGTECPDKDSLLDLSQVKLP